MAVECGIQWNSAITWLIVIGGWYAVHLATLSRERRKEQRESVDKLVAEFKNIEITAIDFHMGERHCRKTADTLTSRIDRAIRSVQRAPLNILEMPIFPMVKFRKSITLNNFDSSNFISQLADSDLLYSIRSSTDDLIAAIELQKDKKLP